MTLRLCLVILIAAQSTWMPLALAQSRSAQANDSDVFEALDRELRREEMQLRIANARQSRLQAERETGEGPKPQGFPALIRIYGAQGAERAQFRLGTAVYEVRPGDAINADWTLDRVVANGVAIRNRGGARRVIVIGREQVTAIPSAQSPATSSQGGPTDVSATPAPMEPQQ